MGESKESGEVRTTEPAGIKWHKLLSELGLRLGLKAGWNNDPSRSL